MREDCRKRDNDCDCPIHRECFPIVVGPTGPTERLFKSSNKIIIDSSLIIPHNEKKYNILHNIS